jgi:aspartyl-tRNA(Asn)/glutamyl-tRNA(Gln) amidotransferase subunit B
MWEQERQRDILEGGGVIEQETRLFDADTGQTRTMRTKEEAHDYRYFPDPDLLPLELKQESVDDLRASLPEHPDDRRKRYQEKLGLSVYNAGVLLNEKDRTDYFEGMLREGAPPKTAANWLINEYLGRVNKIEKKPEVTSSGWNVPWTALVSPLGPLAPSANVAIINMVTSGEISGKTAKDLLEYAFEYPDTDLKDYVVRNNLRQVTDLSAIEKIVDDIVSKNPDKVADAQTNPKAIGWFVGQVMKASGGKANPQAVNDLLKKRIGV